MSWDEAINQAGLRYISERLSTIDGYMISQPHPYHIADAISEAKSMVVGLQEKQLRVLDRLLRLD